MQKGLNRKRYEGVKVEKKAMAEKDVSEAVLLVGESEKEEKKMETAERKKQSISTGMVMTSLDEQKIHFHHSLKDL